MGQLDTWVDSLINPSGLLQKIAELNSASVICITETWLSPDIPDRCVSIPGFNLFRRDRIGSSGGGVCVYLDHEIPFNRLVSCDQSDVESIWISLRPHKLPREITSIILRVIYHSTSNKEPENVVLRDHVQNNLDSSLFKEPNALVLLTGDFNPSSTGFKMKYITHVNHLKQLISFKTRDSAVLDWLLTNRPKLFEVSRLPKVGSSDHDTILAKPNIAISPEQTITKIAIRDMRNSAWCAFGRWIIEKYWSSVLSASSRKDKFDLFMSEFDQAVNTFLPQKMIKKHPTDRPWITNTIKLWIYGRQSVFQQQGKNSKAFSFWRNKVQRAIQSAKSN